MYVSRKYFADVERGITFIVCVHLVCGKMSGVKNYDYDVVLRSNIYASPVNQNIKKRKK